MPLDGLRAILPKINFNKSASCAFGPMHFHLASTQPINDPFVVNIDHDRTDSCPKEDTRRPSTPLLMVRCTSNSASNLPYTYTLPLNHSPVAIYRTAFTIYLVPFTLHLYHCLIVPLYQSNIVSFPFYCSESTIYPCTSVPVTTASFTNYHVPSTNYRISFTIYHPRCTMYHLPKMNYHVPYTLYHLPLYHCTIVSWSQCNNIPLHHLPFAIHHCIMHNFAIYDSPCTIQQMHHCTISLPL